MTQQTRAHVLSWRVSSHSGNSGINCVETGALTDGGFAVRDSKDRSGPALAFSRSAWRAFVDATKSDSFGC